jgi:hypothetical protein
MFGADDGQPEPYRSIPLADGLIDQLPTNRKLSDEKGIYEG